MFGFAPALYVLNLTNKQVSEWVTCTTLQRVRLPCLTIRSSIIFMNLYSRIISILCCFEYKVSLCNTIIFIYVYIKMCWFPFKYWYQKKAHFNTGYFYSGTGISQSQIIHNWKFHREQLMSCLRWHCELVVDSFYQIKGIDNNYRTNKIVMTTSNILYCFCFILWENPLFVQIVVDKKVLSTIVQFPVNVLAEFKTLAVGSCLNLLSLNVKGYPYTIVAWNTINCFQKP